MTEINEGSRSSGKKKNVKETMVDSPKKPSMGRLRKGCMRGKGGPENALCTYRGVRQRTWGKWVAGIREPNRGSRLWLGTFSTSMEAATAYYKAVRELYGPSAQLNLSDNTGVINDGSETESSAASAASPGGWDTWEVPDLMNDEEWRLEYDFGQELVYWPESTLGGSDCMDNMREIGLSMDVMLGDHLFGLL